MRRTRQLKHGDLRITIFPKTGAKPGRLLAKKEGGLESKPAVPEQV